MRFLIRIAEFTEMQFQRQGVLGTDSQSLLDTLTGKDKDPQAEEGPIPIHGLAVVLDVLDEPVQHARAKSNIEITYSDVLQRQRCSGESNSKHP